MEKKVLELVDQQQFVFLFHSIEVHEVHLFRLGEELICFKR